MNQHDLKLVAVLGGIALALTLTLEGERRIFAALGPPSATSSYDLILSGSTKDSVGRTITVTAPVHVEIAEAAPVPVPVTTTILRVESANGAATVTEGMSGQSLELVGTGFPLAGIRRLAVAGQIGAVTQWRSDRVFFALPVVAAPVTGAVQVFLQINNTWVLQATGPRFTIRPAAIPPPVPNPLPAGPVWPRVDKVLDKNLNVKDVFVIGETIILSGGNFGSRPGRLWVESYPVKPILWTDTQIGFSWDTANRYHRIFVQIERADKNRSNAGGGSDSRTKMPFVVNPGETPAVP